MMKLKYLYDNRDLVLMLLRNWEYDEDSLELMSRYRISANAIYPFRNHKELHFLRFSPVSEKEEKEIQAEIDFILYLLDNGYHAAEPVRSKEGAHLAEQGTPWGRYSAVVFKAVEGSSLESVTLTEERVFSLGRQMGRLHDLSSHYQAPGRKRWSHHEVFEWIEKALKDLKDEEQALRELTSLREIFSLIPAIPGNYGLIHYDFEPDNVFFDESSGSFSVIDFDDAMYHWYAMDILQTLDSIGYEPLQSDTAVLRDSFLEGYGTAFSLDSGILENQPAFRRFANLYGYARIKRALRESWPNESGWIVDLRRKLHGAAERTRANFG